jgi:Arc/MetJ-type ribon-helix-helix transcriptional regulator
MSYQFPPDVEELIKQHLASGAYASEDELLRDAIRALDQCEVDKIARWDQRNQLAIEQSNRGLSKPLDDEKILTRLRERLATEGILD